MPVAGERDLGQAPALGGEAAGDLGILAAGRFRVGWGGGSGRVQGWGWMEAGGVGEKGHAVIHGACHPQYSPVKNPPKLAPPPPHLVHHRIHLASPNETTPKTTARPHGTPTATPHSLMSQGPHCAIL